ncbi:MAG TPA: transglycosylase SLT domain-containing protein, partial [Longimicrobiaceae bacterium]|nr:transglycosylase SLT domain-containing protein [Longimicrobiaceae bacterium]
AELPGARTAAEELARGAAYEAGGKAGLAAKALRAAIRAGHPDDPALRLRVGRLLFEARDYDAALANLRDAAERVKDRELAAEAELYAARVAVRTRERGEGMAALRRVSERWPGTAAAGSALFLAADAAVERDWAIGRYRMAAEVRHSPHAREALFRAGDRSRREGDAAGALDAWEEYVRRYPRGDQTAEAAYYAGLLRERAGRADDARALYRAAVAADPVAYYAIRAADRLGADPIAEVLASPTPWMGLASDPREAAAALRRLDALERAGLAEAWKQELEFQSRRFERRHLALLTLAEGVRDRGHPVEGIRLGRRLLEKRGGEWDARLLRVVFPLRYRDLIDDEARRAKVDPFLLAGIVRQESSFDPEARSWVGATGLSQIMPATGKWLAPGAGVRSFDPSLLTVPEVNLRMGARYLRDQLRRYDGARDLALAAYNAGPGRADRWRRELGYGRDVDAFRERIPFSETRGYVKLVLRNAVIYRRLYGAQRSPGLSAAGS